MNIYYWYECSIRKSEQSIFKTCRRWKVLSDDKYKILRVRNKRLSAQIKSSREISAT